MESFWIPHNEFPPKIIIKSRKTFMPYIVIYIDEVNPEQVREILLKYIAETQHNEPFLKLLLEAFLSLPVLYIVRLWEERFVVQKGIKLKF